MKIVQLATQWKGTVGGPTNYVGSISAELRAAGHEVLVAAPAGSGADLDFPMACPARELSLLRTLLRLKPDIVHAHGSLRFLVPALVAKFLRCGRQQVVFTFHTQPTFRAYIPGSVSPRPSYNGFVGVVGSVMLSCVDAVASVSQNIVDNINEHCGMRVRDAVVIPSGACPRSEHVPMPGSSGPVLSSVGVFLWDWKIAGYYIVLEAVSLLRREFPGIRLLIVGDGAKRPLVERKISELGLEGTVELLGNLSSDATEAIVARSDVYVHGALLEGCSLAVVEAMMAGKPIVASAAGGTPEIIKDGETGLLSQPSAEAFADAIKRVLSDKKLADCLSMKAREYAGRELSWHAVSMRYLDLYRSLPHF